MTDGPYFIEHGDVWHRTSGFPAPPGVTPTPSHICDGTELLGIAFDEESGALHKHGAGRRVSDWADRTRRSFAEAGFPDMANDIVVVQFGVSPETVAELNACVACSGRVLTLVERLALIAPEPAPYALPRS